MEDHITCQELAEAFGGNRQICGPGKEESACQSHRQSD
jgi:hypothetical protein